MILLSSYVLVSLFQKNETETINNTQLYKISNVKLQRKIN